MTKRVSKLARTDSVTRRVTRRSPAERAQSVRLRPQLVRRTLQHNVYDFLRECLMAGEFVPGEHLTVRGIAARAGTSVMPVREAFRRLTTEGALEPLSSGATRVPILNREKIVDIMEARSCVEGLAARRAAARMTHSEYQQLCALNEEVLRAARAGNLLAEASANERFHFALYRAAGSEELLRIIQHLWLQVGPYLLWLRQRDPRHSVRIAFRHHAEILDALRRKDGRRVQAALLADLAVAAKYLLRARLPRQPE